jgi:hypothetical protein
MEFHVLYLVGKLLSCTIRLQPERCDCPKKNRVESHFEIARFRAQFSQIIFIILIDRQLALTVYFQKIYSLSILVLVSFEL